MHLKLTMAMLFVVSLLGCSCAGNESVADVEPSPIDYCEAVRLLSTSLGGGIAAHDQALDQVVQASPPDHLAMWQQFSSLSRSFDYPTFNRATDAFDRIAPDLERECNTEFLVVNNQGRIEVYGPE